MPLDRAVTEAAVCQSVNHTNVVATYSYGAWPQSRIVRCGGARVGGAAASLCCSQIGPTPSTGDKGLEFTVGYRSLTESYV